MKNFIYNIKTEKISLIEKTDEELKSKILQLKKRAKIEKLETLIVEWFALVQEISFRQIGLRHFDTQLKAGLYLHQGKIVEMKTGEGKTLASTLPVSLNALSNQGVHVVTVNEYLAERDQKWMGKIYQGLGFSIGLVKSTNTNNEKRKSYNSDITYVTNSEVVFDYLRDSSADHLQDLVQRPFSFCVIDEIDSILIDEARTPLILSTPKKEKNITKLRLAKGLADLLLKDIDFEIEEKKKDLHLTEIGYKKITTQLKTTTLYDAKDPWILEILNALKAKHLFKENKDYIILDKKISIVDESTGRIMEDRRWSFGIHEAIEMKENLEIGDGTKTKSSITYQNFFTLYPKLAGMTGTAKTTEKEFQDIYNLDVVVLETEKPLIRQDLDDLVYQTELAKWKAVVEHSKKCFEKGQPILIGTASVEKSEFLSELFRRAKIPHQVLNAKPENIKRENEIVAQAGEKYAVTIATNMAGRGTDIILGGNPTFKIKQEITDFLLTKKEKECNPDLQELIKKIYQEYQEKSDLTNLTKDIQNLPYSLETSFQSLKNLHDFLSKQINKKWKIENQEVKNLGGLFVLGTERHETRRIDNQLRGRAGRQGDPGSSQFYVSLEDELIKVFGGENISRWVNYLIQDKAIPLESDLLTQSLEKAQTKIELYNYEIRKNVFQYDEVLNTQRKHFFEARQKLLCQNLSLDLFLRYNEFRIDETRQLYEKKIENFITKTEKMFGYYFSLSVKNKVSSFYPEIWICNDLRFAETNTYQQGFLKNMSSHFLLSFMDMCWTEHLERMNYMKETVNWAAYGQQTPLVEYNLEAFKSFRVLFEEIQTGMIYFILRKKIS